MTGVAEERPDVPAGSARLRVGLLAPPWVPVPPLVYGGTEVVVDELALGLTAAGCEVLLFTTGDSTCPVERRWYYDHALGTEAPKPAEEGHVAYGYEVLASSVDVIHDHTLSGPIWGATHGCPVPIVTSIHGQLSPDMVVLYEEMAALGVSIVAISDAQRRSAPELQVETVIHHGIDLTRFPVGRGDGDYLLFLGRMHPDKGPHRAIDVARAAGRPLLLAGKMWAEDEIQYYEEVVAPMLGEDAVYLGEVDSDRKLELLGGAAVLLNPIRWPEPFGLVMIEALACGTPVLAFPEGAAPEIVDQGRTGFLCTDEDDMAARVPAASGLDRAACRASVELRFSTARMVDDHLDLYRRVIQRARAGNLPPTS